MIMGSAGWGFSVHTSIEAHLHIHQCSLAGYSGKDSDVNHNRRALTKTCPWFRVHAEIIKHHHIIYGITEALPPPHYGLTLVASIHFWSQTLSKIPVPYHYLQYNISFTLCPQVYSTALKNC